MTRCLRAVGTGTAAILIFAAGTARGVVVMGPGGATRNASAPTGDLEGSGWQWIGRFNSFCGVPVGPSTFITAAHVGGQVGDRLEWNGKSYRTVATETDPGADLAVWHVMGQFDAVATVATRDVSVGESVMLFGRGASKGAEIRVDKGEGPELAGWDWGTIDGVLRWGTNTVKDRVDGAQLGLYGPVVTMSFDGDGGADEGCLSIGDSGGPLFVRRGVTWHLAGIHFAVEADYRITESGTTRKGTLFDFRGLFRADGNGWTLVPANEDVASPAVMVSTRIQPHRSWLDAAIAKAPAGPTLQIAPSLGGTFTDAANVAHDPVARRFTVPVTGDQAFFRLRGPVSANVTRVARSSNLMTIDYE